VATFARIVRCMLAVGALAIAWSAPVFPQPELAPSTVKAAFLYKFAGYVDWPEVHSGRALVIGVVGADDFARELEALTSGRSIEGRPIEVRRLGAREPLVDLDVLFIADTERPRLAELLGGARDLPILTVTESDGALASGSIINLTVVEDRMRFEVALYAADRSGLRLNSRLLAVAYRVHRKPG
jgi:YfiR/HmsC-like